MQVAMIGLGRMGMNMGKRLLLGGHGVVGYNRTREKTDLLLKEGARGVYTLAELAEKLAPPRVVWLMLPAGNPVDEVLQQLRLVLSPGDIVVDGGNSHYRDDLRRAEFLAEQGIKMVDAGVSGGIWGLTHGYCLMIGADRETFSHLDPLFKTLAPEEGYLLCGPIGAGHFAKMVHNGIEYALLQAYGEGFALLEASGYSRFLDYARLARLWNRGSVIRSWLLELCEAVFTKDPRLASIRGVVEDSGEGRWVVQEAIEAGVPVEGIALSLFQRFRSRQEDSFSDRLIAALRWEFGGHEVKGA